MLGRPTREEAHLAKEREKAPGKPRGGHLSPWMFPTIGVLMAAFSLVRKGTFCPFGLLAFVLMGVFERFFRKWRRSPSNWLSIGCSLVLMLTVQRCVINILVMSSNAWSPRIQKEARVFYRPRFFHIDVGDLVLYRLPSDRKKYVGEIKSIPGSDMYEIYRPDVAELLRIPRRRIKGKIIGVVNPRR